MWLINRLLNLYSNQIMQLYKADTIDVSFKRSVIIHMNSNIKKSKTKSKYQSINFVVENDFDDGP